MELRVLRKTVEEHLPWCISCIFITVGSGMMKEWKQKKKKKKSIRSLIVPLNVGVVGNKQTKKK